MTTGIKRRTEADFGPDPFAGEPDATREDCTLRARAFTSPDQTCDVASKPKRKKTDLNPIQRRWFEQHGWTYARVEHANAWGGMTVDLWGVADYLACRPGEGVLLVQVTTASNAAARLRKARQAPELAAWIQAGGRFEVHSWRQPDGPGTRWEMEARIVTDAELKTVEPLPSVGAARRVGEGDRQS